MTPAARLAGRHWASLGALGLILIITMAWWAFALWPLPAEASPALLRARTICFGTAENGLPSPVGWMLLIGEPLMITLLLLSVTGSHTIREGLRGVAQRPVGRHGLRAVATIIVLALLAAGARVAWALGVDVATDARPGEAYATSPRLDRPAPALGLTDQHGKVITLAALRGRPVIVTFAYAHCETVCPLVVQDVVQAGKRLEAERPAIVVITLDPWRDTPSRLAPMAEHWGLPDDAHVLSGSVDSVTAALDRWGIHRSRDARNGEVIHPAVVYVLDRDGRIAYAATGDAEVIAQLVRRL